MQNLDSLDDSAESRVPDSGGLDAVYRIGAVARLAGVPVTTLRVWEARYAAFAPAKSTGSHRLYTEADVLKARMLRQLTEAGLSIGGIAGLGADELRQKLRSRQRPMPAPTASDGARRRVSAVVIGAALAARLDSPAWSERQRSVQIDVQQVLVQLPRDTDVPSGAQPLPRCDLLLVKLNALEPEVGRQLAAAAAQAGASRTLLLYNYGPDALVARLRAAGVVVRREPVNDAELAELIGATLLVDASAHVTRAPASDMIPPRRYADVALARIAAQPTTVLCECPRHVAELVAQLAAFEEYSQQCLSQSDDDARLHAYLHAISGSARALFEHALDLLAEHQGLQYPTN